MKPISSTSCLISVLVLGLASCRGPDPGERNRYSLVNMEEADGNFRVLLLDRETGECWEARGATREWVPRLSPIRDRPSGGAAR